LASDRFLDITSEWSLSGLIW